MSVTTKAGRKEGSKKEGKKEGSASKQLEAKKEGIYDGN